MVRLMMILAAALLATAPALAWGQQGADPKLREAVREILITDPTLLEEALAAREQRQAAEFRRRIEKDTRAFARGPANAKITIVQFSDYRCPFCQRASNWLHELQSRRPDIRIVFQEAPALGPPSVEAARAAVAALRQGGDRYYAFHRAMMTSKGQLNAARINALAESAGLDVARMREDMADPAIERLLRDNAESLQIAGVSGTPAFAINGQWIVGFDQMALESAIAFNSRR